MRSSSAFALALAVASLLVLLAHAEGNPAPSASVPSPSPSPSPSAPGAVPLRALVPLDAGAPPAGYAPDPRPLVMRQQWVVRLAYRSGDMFLRGAQRVDLPRAVSTPRAFGRFALELYVGKELVDRVRFDFPLLGADDLSADSNGDKLRTPPSLTAGLSTQATVQIPRSDRATRALLVDRATGTAWPLAWPLGDGPDAGAPAG
jgi:hypothetical protein